MSENITFQQSTLSAAASPAKTSVTPVYEGVCPHLEPDSSSRLQELLANSNLNGLFLRTCPDCFPRTKVRTSPSSSKRFANSGMAWRGEFLIASSSESPKNVVESSLSDVLDAPARQRFSLTAWQASKILTNAEKEIPEGLRPALLTVAGLAVTGTPVSGTVMLQWSHQSRDVWETQYATTLQAEGDMPGQGQAIVQGLSARMLSPEEYEALQGFPKGWTDVPLPKLSRKTKNAGTRRRATQPASPSAAG